MLKPGDDRISALYAGGEKIKAAYVGNELVFETKKPSRLPAGYTEVEYISNGTKSNDNYRPFFKMPGTTSAVKMEISFEFTYKVGGTSYLGIYGYLTTDSQGYTLSTYSNQLIYLYNKTAYTLDTDYQINTKYVIEFDYTNRRFLVNGSVVSGIPGTYWRTNANYMFMNKNSSHRGLKIYSIKMWDANNALVLEFVPCINPSGVAGMYDLIGKKFYKKENTSASAEDFTPGPSV